MNKKARAKIPLNPKASFKWVFMDIDPSTAPRSLTSDTTFSNYLLTFDAYYKITKLYGMEKITTEEVMDKLDIDDMSSKHVHTEVPVDGQTVRIYSFVSRTVDSSLRGTSHFFIIKIIRQLDNNKSI